MRVACVVGQGFEDHEFVGPVRALKAAGHRVEVIAPSRAEITGLHGQVKLVADLPIDEAKADDYDALLVPGGFSPDVLRADGRFVDFVKRFRDRPVFAICHGPQLLFTAGLLEGHRVTAWTTVQFDLARAGLEVVDEPVVEDGNLVTSRRPGDIPAFSRAITGCLARVPQASHAPSASP